MKVNVSKTKYINFKGFDFQQPLNYHKELCVSLNCACEEIQKVSSFKYLGLTLDEKLTWENHISALHNKIKSSIRKFYFLRNFCDVNLLRTLYFALVHSRI